MLNHRLIASSIFVLVAATALTQTKGTIAAWPWMYEKGTETARKTAGETVRKIAENKGFTVVDKQKAYDAYTSLSPAMAWRSGMPLLSDLRRYAKSAGADAVMFGNVKWHTRSIWVGSGPKTISTATVDVYIYDVRSNKIVFRKENVEGRSDEKENTLKDIAAVLITPLITVVSGGPATPREQRAVQIALGRAYSGLK